MSGERGDEAFISRRMESLRRSVAEAAASCGRSAEDIQVVFVSKTVPEAWILEAARAGARDFGENRVQELLAKKKNLLPELRWHLIGRLQTNKVRDIIGETVLIHSLDRPDLAREIENQARKKKLSRVPCLIQVNSSGEKTKAGFDFGEVEAFTAGLAADSLIEIQGLMTIGPYPASETEIRKCFRETRMLREDLKIKFPEKNWDILSMGMSGDYRIAIQEGATLLRIGTAVFGERKK